MVESAKDQKQADPKQGDQKTKLTSGEPPTAGPTGAKDEVKDAPKPAAKGDLVPAGESGDPEVHRLLAERQTAETNLAAVTPSDADKDKAEEYRQAIAEIDKQLAKLGVSSG
jgi:hypothetical protein